VVCVLRSYCQFDLVLVEYLQQVSEYDERGIPYRAVTTYCNNSPRWKRIWYLQFTAGQRLLRATTVTKVKYRERDMAVYLFIIYIVRSHVNAYCIDAYAALESHHPAIACNIRNKTNMHTHIHKLT
jgi:hypothetical protein